MTVSQIIANLRREYHALKQAFQASATKINLVTKTIQFSTSRNACNYNGDGINFNYDDNERVVVTLQTTSGANTLANLEISDNYGPPIVRRVPYSGGARWIVTNAPRQSGGNWAPTTYNFTVQTLINGTLSAKMIWD